MKTIGLLGGISWVSTQDYYRLINLGINEALGGLNFAQCLLYSFNYADIKRNNDNNDWAATSRLLSDAGRHLKNGGADCLVLCANTMHLIADEIQTNVGLPLIHIAEATAAEIAAKGLKKVALLGTTFTMEKEFFHHKLRQAGIDSIIPESSNDKAFLHTTIFEELGKGLIVPATKQRYLSIIHELILRGAEGIILGCTEIPLLIQPEDVAVPVFDTTAIHARAIVRFALEP